MKPFTSVRQCWDSAAVLVTTARCSLQDWCSAFRDSIAGWGAGSFLVLLWKLHLHCAGLTLVLLHQNRESSSPCDVPATARTAGLAIPGEYINQKVTGRSHIPLHSEMHWILGECHIASSCPGQPTRPSAVTTLCRSDVVTGVACPYHSGGLGRLPENQDLCVTFCTGEVFRAKGKPLASRGTWFFSHILVQISL